MNLSFASVAERAAGIVVIVRAVRLQRIRRAREHDGPRLRIVLGHIDAREEPHAVAHRDAVLVFGVMLGQPDGVGVAGRVCAECEIGCHGEDSYRKREYGAEGEHAGHFPQADSWGK